MNAPVKEERLIHVEESRARRVDPAAQPLVLQSGSATSLLAAITTACSNPHMDMAKVRELFQMHQTVKMQEAEAAFNAAMARAQSLIEPIVTDKENDHTHSRYATLKAINRKIVPIYSAEGLSVTFNTETKNDADPIPAGELRTVAIVAHSGGFSRRYHIDLPPDETGSAGKVNKTKVQAKGSTNEYARRYLVRMIFNLATGDDRDGNPPDRDDDDEADGREPEAGAQRSGAKAEYPSKEFLKSLPEWKQLMESKKRTADQIIATAESRYTLSEGQKQRIRSAGGSK